MPQDFTNPWNWVGQQRSSSGMAKAWQTIRQGMVLSCPGWFSGLWLVSTEWREPVACVHGMERACGLCPQNGEDTAFSKCLGGEKQPRNASSTNPGKTVTHKTFQETVRRQLITAEDKRRKRWSRISVQKTETSSGELELQRNNKHFMLTWQRLLQVALFWMKILSQVLPYIQDLKNRLNDKYISPFLEALRWPNTLRRWKEKERGCHL